MRMILRRGKAWIDSQARRDQCIGGTGADLLEDADGTDALGFHRHIDRGTRGIEAFIESPRRKQSDFAAIASSSARRTREISRIWLSRGRPISPSSTVLGMR